MKVLKSFLIASVILILLYAGWQFVVMPSSPLEDASLVQETSLSVEPIIEEASETADIVDSVTVPSPSERLVAEPTPRISDQDSAAQLTALLEQYIAGEITIDEIEQEYSISYDTFADFIFKQDWLTLSQYPLVPLAEPSGYRNTKPVYNPDIPTTLSQYQISTDPSYGLHIYAVDATRKFSGIVTLSPELRRSYNMVAGVTPNTWLDQGISVDAQRQGEFNLMMQSDKFGVYPVQLMYFGEGDTHTESLQFLTTPQMLASATVVTNDNMISIYRWRIDYDGDGVIDFVVSNNGIDEKQATEMIDFVFENDLLDSEQESAWEENKSQLIKALIS